MPEPRLRPLADVMQSEGGLVFPAPALADLDPFFRLEEATPNEGAPGGVLSTSQSGRQVITYRGSGPSLRIDIDVRAFGDGTYPALPAQSLSDAEVPAGATEDGLVSVSVVAGQALGLMSPLQLPPAISLLDFMLRPGAQWSEPVVETHTAAIYLLAGEAEVDGRRLGPRQLAVFAREGDAIAFRAVVGTHTPLRLLWLSGPPGAAARK